MFWSLSKELLGTQCHHLQLHKLISDFEEQNPNIIDSLSRNAAQLNLERMRRDTVWGSATELIAVASMLQIPVYTFTKSSSQTYSWHKYSPLQLQKLCFQHNPALKVMATRFAKASYHIELLHFSGCHYDRVISATKQSPSLPRLIGEVSSKDKAVTIE